MIAGLFVQFIRHETEHAPGSGHTNPHDHIVRWDTPDEHPEPGPPINYHGTAPELKRYGKAMTMERIIYASPENLKFRSVSDFKRSMRYGAEVVIEWNGTTYGIWSENGAVRITCVEFPEKNHQYQDSDEALEYMVGEDRLRDVITKVTVLDRTI